MWAQSDASIAGNLAVLDAVELRPSGQRREAFHVGSCHPGLAAEAYDLVEQRGASQRVQVCGNLVQKQDRGAAVAVPADVVGMRQNQADEQRLLLAGGAYAGRHRLWP